MNQKSKRIYYGGFYNISLVILVMKCSTSMVDYDVYVVYVQLNKNKDIDEKRGGGQTGKLDIVDSTTFVKEVGVANDSVKLVN